MIGNQGNRVTRGADAYRRKGVLGWALMCYVCVGIGGYLVTWLLIEKKSIEYQVKYVGAVGNQGWTKWLPLLYRFAGRPARMALVGMRLPVVVDTCVFAARLPRWGAWTFASSAMVCTGVETLWRRVDVARRRLRRMAARDPFQLDRDQTERDTEYGFGAGKYADPRFDYSGGGSISQIPIADPDVPEQLLELEMIKRTDVANPADVPSPYVAGNTDRFGSAPPLVRETKPPKYVRPTRPAPRRMQREW